MLFPFLEGKFPQYSIISPSGLSGGISGSLPLGPPMGSEGLLFFCPIFWSALLSLSHLLPLFVTHALAGYGNCTTKGSTLAWSLAETSQSLTLQDSQPRPNAFPCNTAILTQPPRVVVRVFVHKNYGVLQFLLLTFLIFLGFGVTGLCTEITHSRPSKDGAPPGVEDPVSELPVSESRHQIVLFSAKQIE